MGRMRDLLLLLVLLLVAAACGGDEGGTTTIDGRSANDHGTEDVSGEASVELELDDFYFEPTILEGEPGEQITLKAANEGDEAHTFTSDDLGVDQVFQPGEEHDLTITFPDSGTVVFFCRFHEARGMVGAVEVG